MREFIDERELRPPGEYGVEVHLLKRAAFVIDALARDDLETRDQGFGLGAAMRLHNADRNILAVGPPGARGDQHLIGFADARERRRGKFSAAPCLSSCRARA